MKAASAYTHRPTFLLWIPGGIGFLVMIGAMGLGEPRAPGWIATAGMLTFLGFGFVGMMVGVARESRSFKRFGLLCAGCGQALPGGKHGEVTAHVRETGCCRWCGAPALSDHAGARDALAREAAATDGTAHARAFSRAEFDALVARYRAGTSRWMWAIIVLGFAGMPLIVLSTQLQLDDETRRILILSVAPVLPLALLAAVIASRMLPRRLGIVCPACGKVPLTSADSSVVRTGICPHCSAVIVHAAA